MTILRDQPILETITATHDDIDKIIIDATTKTVSIRINHVVYVDGIETTVKQEDFYFTNHPAYDVDVIKEPHTISKGAVIIDNSPVRTIREVWYNGLLLNLDTDYTVVGNEITFINIADNEPIEVDYSYTMPPVNDFNQFFAMPNIADNTLGQNLRKRVWQALIQLGYVAGTMVDE